MTQFDSLHGIPPQTIDDWKQGELVRRQFSNLAYIFAREVASPRAGSRRYQDDRSFWRDLGRGLLREGRTVVLEGFRLFDFVPRAPGLFHSGLAEAARWEAFQYLDDRLGPGPAEIDAAAARDHRVVFSPQGKQSMLDGGVGCVRLKPVVQEGCVYCLMTASSSRYAHEGIPMAVPEAVFDAVFERLAVAGAVPCDVQGSLVGIPPGLVNLFSSSLELPRLIVRVDDFRVRDDIAARGQPQVSVAVTFLSDYQRPNGIYASYVTFTPGASDSFKNALHWLNDVYVEGGYQGRIITDFDQERSWFPGTAVSLNAVMSGRLKDLDSDVLELMHARGLVDDLFDALERQDLLSALGGRVRTKVFISYSHRDASYLDRLRDKLRAGSALDVRAWDDTQIAPGSRWLQAIRKEIGTAKVAVLLVSRSFLDSSFIREAELPALLEAEERDRLVVLPLFLDDCDLSSAPYLAGLQGVNDPANPLGRLPTDEQDALLTRAVDEVQRLLAGT